MRELAKQSKYYKLKKAKSKITIMRTMNTLGKGGLMQKMAAQNSSGRNSPISPRRNSIIPECSESGSGDLKRNDLGGEKKEGLERGALKQTLAAQNNGGTIKGKLIQKLAAQNSSGRNSPISPRSNLISPECGGSGSDDFRSIDIGGEKKAEGTALNGPARSDFKGTQSEVQKYAAPMVDCNPGNPTLGSLASTKLRSASEGQGRTLISSASNATSPKPKHRSPPRHELTETDSIGDLIAPLLLSFAEARKREDIIIAKLQLLQKGNTILREQVLQLGAEPDA